MPFLTELDSRAEVKGSRDPLGLMSLWSHFGRDVIGNLTTVSSSVRGFTTLLLGLYYAEKLQELPREKRPSPLDVFLKFEQLAGYARVHVNDDRNVRGIRRVRERLTRTRVSISASGDDQILSNQKVYGLWGLFSMPARASELLVPGEQRLTESAANFVREQYLRRLDRRVVDLLRRERFDFEPAGRDASLTKTLGAIHGPLDPAEQDFYRKHLAWGGEVDTTAGRQSLLSRLLASRTEPEFDYDAFRKLRSDAAKDGNGADLVAKLDRIDAIEQLINPARVAFGFLLTRNGRKLEEVAKEISLTWRRPPRVPLDRLEPMRSDLASASWAEAADRWLQIGELARDGEYARFLELLVDMNADVMNRRNGSAPWLSLENGTLRIRMADERENLLEVSEVENQWRSTFFINSLWAVTQEIEHGH